MGKLLTIAEVLACGGVGAFVGFWTAWFHTDMDNAIADIPVGTVGGGIVGIVVGLVAFV
jgi:hypothetical protein